MDRVVLRETAADTIDAALRKFSKTSAIAFDWTTGTDVDWNGDDAVWINVVIAGRELPPMAWRDALRQLVWQAAGPLHAYTRFRTKRENPSSP